MGNWDCQFIRFVLYPLLLFANKIVYPSNGPAAKLLTTLILTLVIMTITGHHMVIQSLPKVAQALMLTLAQVEKVTYPPFAH